MLSVNQPFPGLFRSRGEERFSELGVVRKYKRLVILLIPPMGLFATIGNVKLPVGWLGQLRTSFSLCCTTDFQCSFFANLNQLPIACYLEYFKSIAWRFAARDRRFCGGKLLCATKEGHSLGLGEHVVSDGPRGLVDRALGRWSCNNIGSSRSHSCQPPFGMVGLPLVWRTVGDRESRLRIVGALPRDGTRLQYRVGSVHDLWHIGASTRKRPVLTDRVNSIGDGDSRWSNDVPSGDRPVRLGWCAKRKGIAIRGTAAESRSIGSTGRR